MFLGLIKDQKLIPTKYFDTIYDIDFFALYEQGYRVILTDLDNTLESYKTAIPSTKLMKLFDQLKQIGFKIMIVSNNFSKKRVKLFASFLNVDYLYACMKPTTIGYRRALKKLKHKEKGDVLTLGDQLFTDIYSSNKMGFYSIIVKAIDKKTEVWTTRFNRRLEMKLKIRLTKNKQLNEEIEAYFNGGRNDA